MGLESCELLKAPRAPVLKLLRVMSGVDVFSKGYISVWSSSGVVTLNLILLLQLGHVRKRPLYTSAKPMVIEHEGVPFAKGTWV